mgnify:CR=1 FL=1
MLMEILERGTYSHLVIRNVLNKYDYLKQPSKAFIKRVTEGTIEKQITIDYVLNSCSKTPVSKMKPLIRNLLRLSVYQLLFMDSVPDSAVCNEAVKLAGKRGFRNLQGFVNGVLRNIARTKTQIAYPDETDPVKCYSVCYSMPEWLVTLFLEERGAEITKQIFEEMQKVHPVVLRYCGPEEKKEDWKQSVAAQQITLRQHPYLSYAYLIEGGESVQSIPGYEEGLFTVQDVSSMLAVEAAGIAPGDFVVDVCAAPGGKSMLAAQKTGKEGRVLARDLTETKTALIRENAERLKLSQVEIQRYDALSFDPSLKEKADVVLADLPCSGLGIMGRKRDIKYKVTKDGMKEIAKLQRDILEAIWQYVRPGGVLLYSTCTIDPEENEEQVKLFLEDHPFRLEELSPFLPGQLQKEGKTGMLQLLPGKHETDGFFIARMVRK